MSFPSNLIPILAEKNCCVNARIPVLSVESYKLGVIRQNPAVSFEMECDLEPFEGKVACQYGLAYSTVFGMGTAKILDDPKEKGDALSNLMKVQTGKDFTFDEKMVSIVSVIKITVSEYAAKHRPIPEGLRKI